METEQLAAFAGREMAGWFAPHDYHLHTEFSGDNLSPMMAMCRMAIARGIPEIGFTEHFDRHPADVAHDFFRLDEWVTELEYCRTEFAGKLIIRAGVEVGEPHRYSAEVQAFLQSYPFDYAIGSLHWVGDELVFDAPFFRRSPEEAFRLYFDELERMIAAGGFDVVGHFDVVARTGFDLYGEYDPCRYRDEICACLSACVARGLALDVNAGALRRRVGRLTPDVEILRWYVELGGKRVTFGSDAHRPEHVGLGLERAVAAARSAGLTSFVRFERRHACLEPLGENRLEDSAPIPACC